MIAWVFWGLIAVGFLASFLLGARWGKRHIVEELAIRGVLNLERLGELGKQLEEKGK